MANPMILATLIHVDVVGLTTQHYLKFFFSSPKKGGNYVRRIIKRSSFLSVRNEFQRLCSLYFMPFFGLCTYVLLSHLEEILKIIEILSNGIYKALKVRESFISSIANPNYSMFYRALSYSVSLSILSSFI